MVGMAVGTVIDVVADMVVGKDTVDSEVCHGAVGNKVDRADYLVDSKLPHLLHPPSSWTLNSSWNPRHPVVTIWTSTERWWWRKRRSH